MATDGTPHEEWSAEFHSGDYHRVETPLTRIVANCRNGTGHAIDVATGLSRRDDPAAAAACGVSSHRLPALENSIEARSTPFGPMAIIRFNDGETDARFGVLNNGAIATAEIIPGASATAQCLQTAATAVLDTLPAPDIFTEQSLTASVVPDDYRVAPTQRPTDIWTSNYTCG